MNAKRIALTASPPVKFVAAIVVVFLIGLGARQLFALEFWDESTAAPTIDPTLPDVDILYLLPEGATGPATSTDLSTLGLTEVRTADQLRASAATTNPDAIFIDRGYLGQLTTTDREWVAQQFSLGIILGGINISERELSQTFGLGDATKSLTLNEAYAPDRTYYSFLYDRVAPGGTGGCTGAGTDYLDKGREVNNAGLKSMVRRIAEKADAGCNPAATPFSNPEG